MYEPMLGNEVYRLDTKGTGEICRQDTSCQFVSCSIGMPRVCHVRLKALMVCLQVRFHLVEHVKHIYIGTIKIRGQPQFVSNQSRLDASIDGIGRFRDRGCHHKDNGMVRQCICNF